MKKTIAFWIAACFICIGTTVLITACDLFGDTKRPVILTGIEITGQPENTSYIIDESLDLGGLEVSAIYSDGSSEVLEHEDLSFSGFDSDTPGSKTVIVSYQEHTAEFQVTVAFQFTDMDSFKRYLDRQTAGTTPENPVFLPKQIDLGNMTEYDSGWQELLRIIDAAEKYVALDLSACTMTGTEFDPDNSIAVGKDLIVSLVLPDAATEIADGESYTKSTFQYFSSLTTVSGANIETVGELAFSVLKNLASANFPAAVTIGASAFYECTSLETVYFPNAVNIRSSAFSECTSLVSVDFPKANFIYDADDWYSIDQYVFSKCTSLVSASFPSATAIVQGLFDGCTSLEEVYFPNVQYIDDSAFMNTEDIPMTITLGITAPRIDGTPFNWFEWDTEYSSPAGKIVTVRIPPDASGYDDEWQNDFGSYDWGYPLKPSVDVVMETIP